LSENAARFSRQIPEFATGGFVPGIDRGRDSVMAFLTPGELVLNRSQQAAVMREAGPGVFARAGVPRAGRDAGPAQAFQTAGFAQTATFMPQDQQPIVIDNLNVEVSFFVGKDDQTRIVVNGMSTSQGRIVTANNVKLARLNGEV